jgi:putative inorganic carbon (HCO3(-)) transporter
MLPALLLYLILIIVRPHEFVPALAELELTPYLLSLSFLLWLFKDPKSLQAPQQTLVPLLCLMVVFSLLVRGWLGGVLLAGQQFSSLLMLFFVTTSAAEEPRTRARMMRVACLCTLVLAAHGFDQVLTDGVGWTGQALETSTGKGRIQYIGVFADPNDLAMLFVCCFPLTFYLAAQSGKALRLFWWAGAVALAIGVYLTDSRGGLLGILTIVGVWSTRSLGKVATGVLAAVALPALIAATRLSNLDAGEESAAGRVDAWYTALQLFQHSPLTGVGFGLFTEYNDLTAHNSWLLVLAELGLPGYVLWYCTFALSMQQLWAVARSSGQPQDPSADGVAEVADDRLFATALFYSGIGILVTAFFLSRSYSVLMFLFWGWCAGLNNGALRRGVGIPAVELARAGKRWAGTAVMSIPAFYVLVRLLLIV